MTGRLASVGDRFTANFIDGIASFAIGAACYCVARATGAPLQLAIWAWLAYLLMCDALPGGRSLGKRCTGIAVVQVGTERPCTWWRSMLRRIPLLLLGVLDAAFIAGPARRRLGDYVAGTKVVDLAR